MIIFHHHIKVTIQTNGYHLKDAFKVSKYWTQKIYLF